MNSGDTDIQSTAIIILYSFSISVLYYPPPPFDWNFIGIALFAWINLGVIVFHGSEFFCCG